VETARERAVEVTMECGDLLVFDPMLSHQGSPFRQGVDNGFGARYAQFSVWCDDAAIGDSLAGLPRRPYSAPAYKYTAEMREALPEWARPLLSWELPLVGDEVSGLLPPFDVDDPEALARDHRGIARPKL